jgi:hypothetical protein
MMRNLLIALFISSACLFAQVACDGRIATVRVSEIKEGGTAAGFLAAVAAQKAWYASHGAAGDEIFASPVILRDAKTRAQSYSDKQFITFHVRGSNKQGAPQHDEAYDAFVKLFRDNSEIKSEYNVCWPALK